MTLPVSRFMTHQPVAIGVDATLEECAAVADERRARHLMMCTADGKVAGYVPDTAVFRRVFQPTPGSWVRRHPDFAQDTPAKLVLPADALVGPDESLVQTLDRLASPDVELAIVVDEHRRPLGTLSEHDAMVIASERLPPDRPVESVGSIGVLAVDASDTAGSALALMDARAIRHLIVASSGTLQAVVSRRDLIEADAAGRPELTVEDALWPVPVQTAAPGTPLRHVAVKMAQHRIGCVPVVDVTQRVLRIVTRTDVIRALADQLRS